VSIAGRPPERKPIVTKSFLPGSRGVGGRLGALAASWGRWRAFGGRQRRTADRAGPSSAAGAQPYRPRAMFV